MSRYKSLPGATPPETATDDSWRLTRDRGQLLRELSKIRREIFSRARKQGPTVGQRVEETKRLRENVASFRRATQLPSPS